MAIRILSSENITGSFEVSGKVGIGTAPTSRNLSVFRDTAGSVANFLHYTDASNFAGLYIGVSQSSQTVSLNASGSSGGNFEMQCGNATALSLTSSNATFAGSVGIGITPNNGYKLDVFDATEALFRVRTSNDAGNGGVYIGNGDKNWSMLVRHSQTEAYEIRDETENATRFAIDGSGNAMIGGTTTFNGVTGETGFEIYGNTAQLLINNPTYNWFTIYSASDSNIYNVFGSSGDYLIGTGNKNTSSWSEKMSISSSGSINIGSRRAALPSTFGYSSSYKVLILGSSGANYQTDAVTLSLGVDVSGNPSGAYNGNGREIIIRNEGAFISPNTDNDGYNTILSWNSSGQPYFSQNVGIGVTGAATTLQVSGASLTNNVAAYIGGGFVGNDLYHREGGLLVISGTNATQTSAGIAFQTRNTGNTNYWKSSILMNRGGELEFYTGGAGTSQGTRRLTIQSGGNVGIGTTNIGTQSNLYLGAINSSEGGQLTLQKATGGTLAAHIDAYTAGGNDYMRILSGGDTSTTAAPFVFDLTNVRVGIGTTSPSDYNSYADNLVVADSAHSGISIVSGTTSLGTLMFADGTGGTAGYRGRVQYDHNTDSMNFHTAAAERMRITSDGKVVVQGENFVIDDVREHREEFFITGTSAYNFDVDIKNIGASGQPFEVFVAFTHYSTGYGAAYHAAYYQRSTVQSDITLIHQYFNQNSTRAGAWSVTWLSATQIRISKSAGVGGATGYGYLRVTQVDF